MCVWVWESKSEFSLKMDKQFRIERAGWWTEGAIYRHYDGHLADINDNQGS